jgi:hypothetical protein
MTNGLFQLHWQGEPGATYRLDASTNLLSNSWVPLLTNGTLTGLLDYIDSGATNFPHRFYRAVVP